jgi:hypothetical protein
MSSSKINQRQPAIGEIFTCGAGGLDDPEMSVVDSRKRHMSKRQKTLQLTIDELLEICKTRGIGTQHLRQAVHEVCTGTVYKSSTSYPKEVARAAKISAAGVTAQLGFLKQVWGLTKLTRVLNETGGLLDAIVRATSPEEEVEIDIGRDQIDANGDVI